jgi:hypothetical protein
MTVPRRKTASNPRLEILEARLQPSFLVHDYQLAGNYHDSFGGPDLVPQGGTLDPVRGYAFGSGQGLSLSGALTDPGNYRISIHFRFDSASGWRKIIDPHNLGPDVGLYVNPVAHLRFFPDSGDGAANFATGVMTTVDLVRDGPTGQVSGFINGVQQWSFSDTTFRRAVFDGPGNVIWFFKDDATTGGVEVSPGFVDEIQVYGPTPPPRQFVLIITDPSNPANKVVVADNAPAGTQVVGPGGQLLTTTAADESSTVGLIQYSQPIGPFYVDSTLAASRPVVQGQPALFVHSLLASNQPGSLNIMVSDTGYAPIGTAILQSPIGGTTAGVVNFQEFVDPNNAPFGAPQTPGLQGPYTGAFSDQSQMPVNLVTAFSVTKVLNISEPAGGITGVSAWGLLEPVSPTTPEATGAEAPPAPRWPIPYGSHSSSLDYPPLLADGAPSRAGAESIDRYFTGFVTEERRPIPGQGSSVLDHGPIPESSALAAGGPRIIDEVFALSGANEPLLDAGMAQS